MGGLEIGHEQEGGRGSLKRENLVGHEQRETAWFPSVTSLPGAPKLWDKLRKEFAVLLREGGLREGTAGSIPFVTFPVLRLQPASLRFKISVI